MQRVPLKAVADLLGMVAVVLSLIFVGYQIRQNTIATRAAAYQALGLHASNVWNARAMDPSFASLMADAQDTARWHGIDQAGWYQLAASLTAFMRGAETVYLQVQEGLLPDDALGRLGFDVASTGNMYPVDRLWPTVKPRLSEEFASYVEEKLGLAPPYAPQ